MKLCRINVLSSIDVAGKPVMTVSGADWDIRKQPDGVEVSYPGGMTFVPMGNVRSLEYVEAPAAKKK